ncbi:hypothetical protein [Uliginosibacterium sediminicola]|uniref:HEPN domain-containing protein n=1 Tax=Uliginosibacterium sediminicola TaxID=2024550 RepID=A0ABU9YWD1_9RHOO
MKAKHLIRSAENLRQAVQTMRDACDSAERYLEAGDSNACQRVLHCFAWGFANASSSIKTAMAHIEDAHELAALHDTNELRAVLREFRKIVTPEWENEHGHSLAPLCERADKLLTPHV